MTIDLYSTQEALDKSATLRHHQTIREGPEEEG
jgi:hypothetical protein